MDINLFNLRKMFQPDNMIQAPVPNQSMMNQLMNEPSLNDLYKPEHQATDQFNQLLSQYPTEQKPSLMRKIGAALLNLGGQDGMAFLDQPNQSRIEEWKNRINPSLSAANLERNNNINERQLAQSTLTNRLNTKKAETSAEQGQQKINQGNEKIALDKKRTDAYIDAQKFKENHPNHEIKEVAGGNYVFFNPQNPTEKPIDTGIKTGELTDTQKANLTHTNRMAEITQQGVNSTNAAQARGWTIQDITDPNDPTKKISAWVNPDTKKIEPIKMNGQATSITKPSTTKNPDEITNQTKTMMEGSQMLWPHVADLRKQAADLDRRGLFGPVMSRIRNLAAKVGTTGSPEEVQKNLENLSNTISSDPILNQSNDAAVGQFLTNLGLLTSGMGRVHGGARGGGSIQMINYLKSLLSSESTLSMFNGRINSIDDYLKGYAAGPKGTSKTKLDAAIDKILGGR